jgi:S1-C subfamily serine protease
MAAAAKASRTGRLVGACASILLHLSLLLSGGARQPQGETTASALRVERAEDEAMQLLASATGDGNGDGCPHSYRGIGVVIWDGTVIEVVSESPADRAGMRVGDYFMNADMFARNEYQLGRSLVLRVRRQGTLLELPVRIGKVCYDRRS